MSRRSMAIRTLDDFLKVPGEDLGLCLKSFRQKIERTKLAQADAKRLGASTVVPFDVFEWSPNSPSDAAVKNRTFEAATRLAEMGLRPSAVYQLGELKIYCLEDCAEASQNELLRTPDIGRSTVLKIREHLNSLGMDFKESANRVAAAHDRARLLRMEPLLNRKATITDESDVAQLGLRTATFGRCLERALNTVGKLRSLTPRDVYMLFGKSSRMEIAQTLESIGLTLHCNPPQLDLWRYGMRLKKDMQFPGDDAPVLELQPWLGAAVNAFERSGVSTVGELKTLIRSGGGRVKGIGKSTAQRVADLFALELPQA